MTVASSSNRVDYTGNGVTTVFSFSFRIFEAADLVVTRATPAGVETTLVLNTDYTVTGAGSYSGGSITLSAALTNGHALTIQRVLDITQETDLRNQGQFFAETHEDVFDRVTMIAQQLQEQIDRSAKLPVTNTEDAEALVDDLIRLADSADNIDTLVANLSDITTVADDLNEPVSEINTVAGSIANVNTVGTNISNVNTVAGVSANVTTVAGISSAVSNVSSISSAVSNVSSISSAVSGVNSNSSNINTVAGISGNVTTVAGVSANVTTVAGISSNVTTVAGISSDVTSVAGNATNINAVVGNATNINAVNANKSNIDTVAGNNSNINTVAGISGNVTTVANISANVTTVAGNNANVTTVATNIASVNSAATNMAAIIAAPAEAASAAASAAAAAASAASGMYSAVQDKSADYTVVVGDAGDLIRVTTTGGARTITLPTISTVSDGFKVAIVKWTGDTNQVTVARSGSDTINGATTATIGSQYTTTTFVADFETGQWLAVTSGLGSTNVAVDAFSGTGAQTAFTLSGDPGTENNTQVFVGGVYQEKDTYSVSGTTLTFSAAPPSGTSNIEVVWTQPLSVGVPSDGTVSTAKIADSAVTTAKIADANVTTAKVADGAVTSSKLDTGAATGAKLGSDVVVTSGSQTVAGVKTFSNQPVFSAGVDLSSNGQIKFPATQNASSDANTLDDYEEGTWTPRVTYGGSDSGQTYTVQNGRYTKVGNIVHVFGYAQVATATSATGSLRMEGLPFSKENNSDYLPVATAMLDNASSALDQPVGFMDSASSVLILAGTGANNATALTDTVRAGSFRVRLSVTYRV